MLDKTVNKNYNGIDIIKFLCAIMVFMIHIRVFIAPAGGELPTALKYMDVGLRHCLCRLAVPFYFTASGFFLFKKMPRDSLDTERVKNYCFKLLRLLGIWIVLLFMRDTFHLWYLCAAVVAIAFLSLCLHRNIKDGYLVLIAVVLYIIGLLGDSYFGFVAPFVKDGAGKHLHSLWRFFVVTTRNGLFMGYAFVLMGYFFAKGKFKLKTLPSLLGLGVSLLCLLGEAALLIYHSIPADYNMYIFLVPSVFFLFAFACSLQLKDRPIYAKLRTVGVLAYFLHILVNSFVSLGTELIYNGFGVNLQPFRFFISLAATLLLAVYIGRLSRREKFGWLGWFIA